MLYWSVIAVGKTFLDKASKKLEELIEVIRGVSELGVGDAQGFYIFKDGLYKLILLLGRIGVIESHDHFA